MIPNSTAMLTTQGSLGGTEIDMTVDFEDMTHIMNMFTDLYSDQESACIREYSTNAYDANVEKWGEGKFAIEVTTPSAFSPFFSVKDSGEGLNEEDIRTVYSKYGKSTKRTRNDVVGMLGLGCKAALSYTNSFTVRSVQNGHRTEVVVRRRQDGTGVMEVLESRYTGEPSGTEVTIPVKEHNTFIEKCEHFFSFWQPGTVLVNGRQPKRFEGTEVATGIYQTDHSQSYIVMGNVPYVADFSRYAPNGLDSSIVAYVEMGAVAFPPNREELMYEEKTIAAMKKISGIFKTQIISAAQKDIDSAATYKEAYQRRTKWHRLFRWNCPDFKYNGNDFPSNLIAFGYLYRPGAYRSVTGQPSITLNEAYRYVIVTGYNTNLSGISSAHKQKINRYREKNNISERMFFIDSMPKNPFFNDVTIVNWSDIAAIRNPRKWKPTSGWRVVNSSGLVKTVDELPKKKLVFVSPTEEYNYASIQRQVDSDAAIVVLSRNRWDKFKREYKGVHLTSYLTQKLREEEKRVTVEYKTYLDASSLTRALDPNRIDDPEFAKYIRVVQAGASDKVAALAYSNIMKINSLTDPPNLPEPVRFNMGRYPLTTAVPSEHVYIYVNAVYAVEKDK